MPAATPKEVKPLSPAAQQAVAGLWLAGECAGVGKYVERAVLLSSGPSLEPWDFWMRRAGTAAAAPGAGAGVPSARVRMADEPAS